ncbi:MAG: ATP-binding protein [Muribaculaceae bacterium]|nr:ATP-binding protein [Muribaculaceae bacterium]MCM1399008.1 ATP-binding protein [Clostridium sp.]MCM1458867.1 ATP-binding protein [Bacteroides sp.]
MQSMVFQVSAKTARLIGRENISDVDGAIVELVKNGYDADAECVYVKYINPYNEVPKSLTRSEVNRYFKENMNLILDNYSVKDGVYVLNESEKVNLTEMEQYLHSISKIIVIDNGSGMSREILESAWMNIGTDNKEVNIYSPKKKRIKTGAKGIGRFALDKLSFCTRVFTKCETEQLYKWEIDWRQFDDAKLLNQVEASFEECGENFEELVKKHLDDDYVLVKDFGWTTGTMIILSPVRDLWDEKLYTKVNNNLKNINPLGSVDRFDVFVRNEKYPNLNYETESEGITRENYDYLIEANFDGKGNVSVTLDRNEIDITKKVIRREYSPTDIEEYDLNEFWSREAFELKKYTRNDFDGKQEFHYSLKEILENPKERIDRYNDVGPFCVKMYYLKNQKSTVGIVKDFKGKKRKQLLKDFSGIKIYRDSFKVRPYGDEGQFFDWIDLGGRVQRSPAAASHESGNWRVSSNQLIGSVSIGRVNNPKLEDNANREGMSSNREYDCFIEIIQGILGKFEYDRQYALREYAAWERAKKKAHEDKVQQIYEQVLKEREQESKKEQKTHKDNAEQSVDNAEQNNYDNNQFSEDDLKDAIVSLGKEKEDKTSTEQLMMILSSAGVMAQTFSHEITRIGTQLGSRGQHLKEAINRMLNYQPFCGDEDFNPYVLLGELNETDELLSEWVNLIMDSIKQEKFESKSVQLKDFLIHITEIWQPLLDRKFITINSVSVEGEIELRLPEVDLHLILNNFILNSAYYLEEADGIRLIDFSVYEDEKKVYLEMSNNGPELDERYRQNPDATLNARESSKEDGTGLGLWIAREAVIRNAGELHVIPIKNGYMLKAAWAK